MLFRDLQPLQNIFTLIVYIAEGFVKKKNHSHFWHTYWPLTENHLVFIIESAVVIFNNSSLAQKRGYNGTLTVRLFVGSYVSLTFVFKNKWDSQLLSLWFHSGQVTHNVFLDAIIN